MVIPTSSGTTLPTAAQFSWEAIGVADWGIIQSHCNQGHCQAPAEDGDHHLTWWNSSCHHCEDLAYQLLLGHVLVYCRHCSSLSFNTLLTLKPSSCLSRSFCGSNSWQVYHPIFQSTEWLSPRGRARSRPSWVQAMMRRATTSLYSAYSKLKTYRSVLQSVCCLACHACNVGLYPWRLDQDCNRGWQWFCMTANWMRSGGWYSWHTWVSSDEVSNVDGEKWQTTWWQGNAATIKQTYSHRPPL